MVNARKLKGKMVENGIKMEGLAAVLGVDRATVYRKFQGDGGSFTIREANLIVNFLGLSKDEANEIFFADEVA